jgi:class 3 adenylate cyclase
LSLRRAPDSRPWRGDLQFTDIVGSTALLEAIGDNAWSDLRRWHDETLRRCVADEGGEEVDHTGDGFFVSFRRASAVPALRRSRRLADTDAIWSSRPRSDQVTRRRGDAAGSNQDGRAPAARAWSRVEAGEIVASVTSVEGLGIRACRAIGHVEGDR